MPKAVQKKSKDKIKAAASQSKKSKKKWSKGKVAEKVNHAVFFSNDTLNDVLKNLNKLGNLVSVSNLIEKFKISGSLARVLVKRAQTEGLLRCVESHSKQALYAPTALTKEEVVAEVKEDKKDKKKKK